MDARAGYEVTRGSRVRAQAGPIVFSFVAWAILAPFMVSAYGGFEQGDTTGEQLTGFAIAVLVHLALLPVFFGAGAVERRLIARPWWRGAWLVLVVLAIAFARPSAISALHELTGVTPVISPWWLRVLLNAAVVGASLLVIYAVALVVARRSDVRDRLDSVLDQTARNAGVAAQSTARLVAEYERAVADPVRRALAATVIEPFEAIQQERALRRMAHEVVRPLSHHVFEAEPAPAAESHPMPRPTRLRWPTRILAAPSWAPPVVFSAVMLPVAIIGFGPGGGILRLLVAFVVALLGCWLLGLVRIRARRPKAVVLAVGYLAIGVGLAAIFLDVDLLPLPPRVEALQGEVLLGEWAYVAVAFLVLSMMLVIMRSELAEANAIEEQFASLLRETQQLAATAQVEHAAVRAGLARVLHNQVQGEIIALALRLKLGSANATDVEALLHTVDQMLAEAVVPAPELIETVTAETMARNAQLAIASWSRAMEVRSAASPEVWDWLAPRPRAAAVLLDAAVEGLTNAVRHDDSRSAHIEFTKVDERVRLTLRTQGRLRASDKSGFGLADLRRRGAVVDLSQEGREVVLRVEVAEY